MKNNHIAKTLTASLSSHAQDVFARISDPENLSQWHSSFCRALRRENGSLIVESPRGAVPVRFLRDDHALVVDILVEVTDGIEMTNAIRLLPNGEGSEIIWTLIKPEGLSDSAFHEQLRWAGNALHALRKAPVQNRVPSIENRASITATPSPILDSRSAIPDAVEPMQAPSPDEVSSMPLSGKKLFIGNLSYDWKDEELHAHFAESGVVVTAEVARFRGRGGRSRGFGFVEMTTEAEAQAAIEKLHGGMAGGRQIIVRLAKSQESRPARANATVPEIHESPEPVERGNERTPRAPRPPSSRQRIERPRRGGVSRPRPTGEGRSYVEQDISNKSGYEIFRRRAPGSSEPAPSSSAAPAPSRPSREPSPYMDDTGDIENHGHRPPRHRRR